MKTYLDWSAYDTYGIGDAYSGIPATGGNYAKAVAVCMHSHDCRKSGKGLMCPSFRSRAIPPTRYGGAGRRLQSCAQRGIRG